MRMPRLSLRAMMMVVAVVALTLGVSIQRRRDHGLRRAQVHSEYRDMAGWARGSSIYQPGLEAHHADADMATRYLGLAATPWEPLPRDDDAVDFMVGGR